jgi:hypothetical protein
MTKREWMKIPKKVRLGLGHLAAIVETQIKRRPSKYAKQATEELNASITWIWHQWAKDE